MSRRKDHAHSLEHVEHPKTPARTSSSSVSAEASAPVPELVLYPTNPSSTSTTPIGPQLPQRYEPALTPSLISAILAALPYSSGRTNTGRVSCGMAFPGNTQPATTTAGILRALSAFTPSRDHLVRIPVFKTTANSGVLGVLCIVFAGTTIFLAFTGPGSWVVRGSGYKYRCGVLFGECVIRVLPCVACVPDE